jgi:hypothetical protein
MGVGVRSVVPVWSRRCLHHRVKTHGGWTYDTDQPGSFRWRSPYRYTLGLSGS